MVETADRGVYRQIKEMVLSGSVAPGRRLIEAELAQELGVSRTPIREALRRLESDGLVNSVPNAGCVVADFLTDIQEIYLIRERLEGLSARLAAEVISPDQLARLRELQEQMQQVLEQPGSTELLVSLNRDFHTLINNCSQKRRVQRILEQLLPLQAGSHALSLYSQRELALSIAEHDEILAALEGGDGAAADSLTARHMRRAARIVARAWDRSGSGTR